MEHEIAAVAADGIAEQLGIEAGDFLVRVNGKEIADWIDYTAFTAVEKLRLLVRRGDETTEYAFTKDEAEGLGLLFCEPLLSRTRLCANKCLFCFVDQLPPGARESLRVKDDDWRLSLMMGNFVTLTNVKDRELERIIARRASPLYISVHAMNPQLRARLLGTELGKRLPEQLKRLAEAGLRFHAQAVLCPGLNDGAEMERTVSELAALFPACLSLALVPVGLSGHRAGLEKLKPFDGESAGKVLDAAEIWREKLLNTFGTRFVFPADELYLLAGRAIPPEEAYEDYAQIENGVGLLRTLWTQYEEARADAAGAEGAAPNADTLVACGTSLAPFMQKMLAELPPPGGAPRVVPVENGFFGSSVTVSGLLTGSDLIRALAELPEKRVLFSRTMLREGETVFLDDTTLERACSALGKQLVPVADGCELFGALSRPRA